MNDRRLNLLTLFPRLSAAGWILGLLLMVSSLFVSGLTSEYTLHVGIGFAVASTFIFMAGLGILLMSELQKKVHQ
jgi:hypothetical protein